LRGELVLGRKTVADRGSHVTVLREREAEFVISIAMAGAKSAAVNANDRRQRSTTLLWTRQVELQMLIIRIGIFNSLFELDIVGNDQVRSVKPRHREDRHGAGQQ